MVRHFVRDRRGYSLTWAAAFLAILLVPLLLLGIEIGRWEHARGELYKAADLAALAAAQEVDIAHFRETGEVLLLPSALEVAQRYVAANAGYLARNGISARVADIAVDQSLRQVEVTVVADISSLFPAWAPRVIIHGRGTAVVSSSHFPPLGGPPQLPPPPLWPYILLSGRWLQFSSAPSHRCV